MKKVYLIFVMSILIAMASVAQIIPKGASVPFNENDFTFRRAQTFKADGDVLVTPPESAIIETDWAIEGTYLYGDNNIPFVNDNPIWVAYDGVDIYFKGLVLTCPNAWIKGKMIDNVVSFANGQFCGVFNNYNIYACGSSDAVSFTNLLFQYDPEENEFSLANIYIENTYPDQQQFIFFSYNLVIYKDVKVPVPTDLTVVPDVNKAEVSWTSDASRFNLRYRKFVDMSDANRFWDFEDADQASEFTLVDNDGDGRNWTWIDSKVITHSGNGIMYSASYDSSEGAINPDNWLITPKVKLGGSVSFYAAAQDPNYSTEKFQVYLFVGDEWESVEDFTAISDLYTSATSYQKYSFDLSEYEGYGYIAIRHYNSSDQYWLNIDDIEVLVPDASGATLEEWNEFAGVPNPYTITNLEPETKYEVQVCAFEDDASSPWTESAVFTTLSESVEETTIDELYVVGTFNDWNLTEEGGRVPFVLNGSVFVANVEFAYGDEFKLIAPDPNNPGGWKWFGGIDEMNVGYFLITEELLDQEISLVDGSNFRIERAGEFIITVRSGGLRGLYEPMLMTITENNPTAVSDLAVDATDNAWYNIQGMKLKGAPNTPGIYINGGKKVVVK